MTRATAPMTMVVSAPTTQAASRSVAAAASAVLGARGVVSVTATSNAFRNLRPTFLPPPDHARCSLPPSLSRPTSCLPRSEEHTSELQSLTNLVCRLLLEKKNHKRTH